MQLLKDRIRKDGVIKDGNVLKVDSFLNHQMDIALINEMGKEFRRRFPDESINKILTIEASGIGIACITAQYFNCPVVFAKKTQSINIDGEVYSTQIKSFTHGRTYDVIVKKAFLSPEDNILIIDDFLANGCALLGLIDIVKHAGAKIAGAGIVIEKGCQKGAYCIGYNFPTADAAPDAYLTAACFNWSTFYTDDCQRALDGTWTSRAYWEGLAANMTYLDDLTALCAEGTQEKVDAARDSIIDGSFDPFTGPLYDQNGELKVEDGVKMTDDEIWNMNWFVQGVVGSIPA